jgi:hypothetical protein
MHYTDAVSGLRSLTGTPPHDYCVTFVSPIVSTMLAAACNNGAIPVQDRTKYAPGVKGYADNCGLSAVLNGTYEFPQRSGKQGHSYAKLTRLSSHSEVDCCNQIINDLIFEHLEQFGCVAGHLAKVVGELHDNVASHAGGLGYSSAQVYNDGAGRRIEFAIADGGCGMLRNVRQVVPNLASHAEAIAWCLVRGNTTARRGSDGWEQRLPDDATISPYPPSAATRSQEDHHIGEGLWKLAELTKNLDGRLWVTSGDGQVLLESGKQTVSNSRMNWSGVAIELELVVAADSQPTAQQQAGIERIAQRVGL